MHKTSRCFIDLELQPESDIIEKRIDLEELERLEEMNLQERLMKIIRGERVLN